MDEKRLKQIAAAVAAVFPCRRILVFGSRARGDFHEGSDVNLLVVATGKQQLAPDSPERAREVKRRVDLPDVDLDPHVFTEAELKSLRQKEDAQVLQMLAEGRVVYEQQ